MPKMNMRKLFFSTLLVLGLNFSNIVFGGEETKHENFVVLNSALLSETAISFELQIAKNFQGSLMWASTKDHGLFGVIRVLQNDEATVIQLLFDQKTRFHYYVSRVELPFKVYLKAGDKFSVHLLRKELATKYNATIPITEKEFLSLIGKHVKIEFYDGMNLNHEKSGVVASTVTVIKKRKSNISIKGQQ